MCETNLAQENIQLQCFFMVKHVTVWQPKHDRATKRDTNILWSNQYEHCLFKNTLLFVQKYAVVCSKTCFKILVLKCFKRCVSFHALKTYLHGIRNLFVEHVLKHDWAKRLRRHPAISSVTGSTQALSARKKNRKQMRKMQITEQNYWKKTCHITKIK